MSKSLLFAAAALSLATASAHAQQAIPEGDATAGAAVFKTKTCQVCHSVEPKAMKVGPSLYGVVGRTPGTLEGYKYSPAMVEFGSGGAVWDRATLFQYLAAPRDLVPKTKMVFAGLPNPQDRANVIAYLESLGGGAAQ